MKKLTVILFSILLLVSAGCAGSKKKEPVPVPPSQPDTSHLTAEDKGLEVSISREMRALTGMIASSREGYEVYSIQVAVANNSKDNVPISPDFVTLKASDRTEYKYSPDLTETVTSKAAFKEVTLPPDYRGGGLLIFELKKGSVMENLNYKDDSGHDMTVKFPSDVKVSI
ncbi:MAG: DUF4352 domain-containing protein [Nitrospiraceae bacterium]|nr:MAG: DUF4352 domain-containing protein [Nitrospiraceae bacterium]